MNIVQFIRGPFASYDPIKHADAIFFATDRKIIYLDGCAYGAGSEAINAVEDVQINENILTITYTTGESKKIDLTLTIPIASSEVDGLMSAQDKKNLNALTTLLNEEGIVELSSTYISEIKDVTVNIPINIGGFTTNVTVGQLNGKTYNQILDDLLFPPVNPTHGTPYVNGVYYTHLPLPTTSRV